MIAIVSPILAMLTIVVAVWMTVSVRLMRAESIRSADSWEVWLSVGWLKAAGAFILAISLMVHNPPQAIWEHPLLWWQFGELLQLALLAWFAHNIVANYRRRQAGRQYAPPPQFQPLGR